MIFTGEQLHIFGQIFLAATLGMLLGIERELAKKTAGVRTYALVSTGAAIFTIISDAIFEKFGAAAPSMDPSRIASQIVVGIGFLGAGIIVFHESRVKGLTTAAGLWVAAAIGMAVGFKLYAIALFSTLITLFIFVVLWYFENMLLKRSNASRATDE